MINGMFQLLLIRRIVGLILAERTFSSSIHEIAFRIGASVPCLYTKAPRKIQHRLDLQPNEDSIKTLNVP
jgi:hypothetical protein